MIVVGDTGPVNYLILSGHVALVHELYEALLIPTSVLSFPRKSGQGVRVPKE
jgi:predicted nucleic acid-binding protein